MEKSEEQILPPPRGMVLAIDNTVLWKSQVPSIHSFIC